MDDVPASEVMPAEHNLPPHLQNQPGFQHMRSHAPSASPPISNGAVPFHNRQHTPQPQIGSRPSSRNNVRRQSSNLVPQHQQQQVSHGPSAPNGFAYVPNMNPVMYGQHPTHGLPGPLPGQQPPPQPQYQFPSQRQQQPRHPQVQQTYMQDQRRQSMPPTFPQHERPQQQQPPPSHQQQPPPPLQRHTPTPPQSEPEQRSQELLPQQPKPIHKSRSIFTPIDDSSSLLAQHWGIGTTEPRSEAIKLEKDSRSQSVDIAAVHRGNGSVQGSAMPRHHRVISQPQRNQSISSATGDASGAKRPRLTVQIPSEQSDDGGSATAGSSPRESAETGGVTPTKTNTEASHSSGVVLPPPSPSASALLSAGAQGPPNPFARPHPPINPTSQNSQAYNPNNSIETPISALPSRFVADGLLPSPSSFYPEWGFNRSGSESNMMPSPLNFQTPVVGMGSGFLRDEEGERKRKSPEGDGQQEQGNLKRVKA